MWTRTRVAAAIAVAVLWAFASNAIDADGIRRRLAREISVNFDDTPLGSALRYMQKKVGVNIVVDRTTVGTSTLALPMTFQVKAVPAAEVLRWLTRMSRTHYEIREQAVLVSSREAIMRKRVVLRVYDVRDLTRSVADFSGPDPLWLHSGASREFSGSAGLMLVDSGADLWEESTMGLAQMIQQRVRPADWAAEYGTSIEEQNGKLIIVNLPEAHREIEELLAMVREQVGGMVCVSVRAVRIPRGRLDDFLWDTDAGDLGPGTLAALEDFVGAEPDRTLASTRLTCFNTQRVYSYGGASQSFVADYEITGDMHDPLVRRLMPGLAAGLRPIASGDGTSILMDVELSYTRRGSERIEEFRPSATPTAARARSRSRASSSSRRCAWPP